MSIVRKGSRPIMIDSTAYRWTIRPRPTYCQGLAANLTFAVELALGARTTLVVTLPSARPDNWTAATACVVSPAIVERAVRQALSQGWRPAEKGGAFKLALTDSASRDPKAASLNAPMEFLFELIVSAFSKFRAADLSIDRAYFGLRAIWIVDEREMHLAESASPLERALACCDVWNKSLGGIPNPYADLVSFYETGAALGRWENKVLDVHGPNGEKLWGVPLQSFINAADKLALAMTPVA